MQAASSSASFHKPLLAIHIAASAGLLGVDLVLVALGAAGLGGADPLTVYPAAHLIGANVLAPLAVLSLGSGIVLALTTQWGLFRYWWVTIKLAVATALTVTVLFVLVPRLRAISETVTAAPAPLDAAGRLPLAIAPAAASSLLLLALVLAVFKPSWRLRSGE